MNQHRHQTISIGLRSLKAGLAITLYAWLLVQSLGVLPGPSVARGSNPDHSTETVIAQTVIEVKTRQCVHHRVACPPTCHCPPLKPESVESGSHDADHHAESDERPDLLPGERAYETCHSLPQVAMVHGGIPAHLLNDGMLPFWVILVQSFAGSALSQFENVDLSFPDKVPIVAIEPTVPIKHFA